MPGAEDGVERRVVPLSPRRLDLVLLAFFVINLLFITYVVDLEQLVIANPHHFSYPWWPPRPAVDLVHWWGSHFDPDLMARPVWWTMTIWIDDLGFGPLYVLAICAYVRGWDWIRLPSVIYASMLFTKVVIILGEEYAGATPSPHFAVVLLANLPWLVFPALIVHRMAHGEHPFTEAIPPTVAPVAPAQRRRETAGA